VYESGGAFADSQVDRFYASWDYKWCFALGDRRLLFESLFSSP
jgi:hypothetical protein